MPCPTPWNRAPPGKQPTDPAQSRREHLVHRSAHRLENPTAEAVTLIEVRCGDHLGEDDMVRLDDTHGRTAD